MSTDTDESAWARIEPDPIFAAMRAKLPRPVWRCEPRSSDPADVAVAREMERLMNEPGGPIERHYDAFIKAEVDKLMRGAEPAE